MRGINLCYYFKIYLCCPGWREKCKVYENFKISVEAVDSLNNSLVVDVKFAYFI